MSTSDGAKGAHPGLTGTFSFIRATYVGCTPRALKIRLDVIGQRRLLVRESHLQLHAYIAQKQGVKS